ncbi:MAG: leucine-rich repeat domain-containing protein [Aureispira sp.]
MDNKIYPFKFLDSYTVEDKDLFFGRDEEVRQLYQMIYQSDTLLLYGASGTGKTSLIQCGLASQFQKHDWLDVFVRRHKNLNESLHKALIAVGGQGVSTTKGTQNLDWLDDIMGHEKQSTEKKDQSTTQLYLKNIYLKHFRPIYLIFDQFEELFILGKEEEQQQFIRTVKEILQVEQPVKLIFSIREEYLGSLYEFEKAIPELLHKKLRIDPMNLEKAKAVVLGATRADKSIVHIEETEAEKIAEQVFEKIKGKEKTLTIQLPYLQVFLDKYYRHISKDKSKVPTTEATFTLAALAELGDIGNILRDFLEEQIIEIAKEQGCHQKTIWKILSPFVTMDGTKEPIGFGSLQQQLPDIESTLIQPVLAALMNNRILRFIEEEELYEIAHDSLALRIAEKRSDDEIALLEVRHLIKSQSLLKDEARELFSEKQLVFISPFLQQISLNTEEKTLIEESQAQVLKAQKERTRRRILMGLLLLLFFAIIFIFALYSQAQKTAALTAKEMALVAKEEALRTKEIALEAKNEAEKAREEALVAKVEAELSQEEAESSQKEAEREKTKANVAQKYAELEKGKAERANQKNEKIINALDFYEDDLALAFNNGKYGFINKNGDPIIPYEYDRGEPFDPKTGFAEMEIMNRERKGGPSTKIKYKYTKYLVASNATRYQLLNLAVLLNRGNSSNSILSKDEIAVLQQQLTQSKADDALLNKLNNVEESRENAYTELFYLLNKTEEKLALDFSDLTAEDALHALNRIQQETSIRDRVALLSLEGVPLEQLPDNISTFQNIKRLNLNDTKLTSLPNAIGSLSQLKQLDLRRSSIEAVPSSIGQLQNLKELYLPRFSKTIPASLFELKNLEILLLGQIKRTSLPKAIGQLEQLKSLSLKAPLETFPEGILTLKNLEELTLSGTKIQRIPTTIGNLSRLKKCTIEAPLEEFPMGILQLKALEHLELSKNKLTHIPEAISALGLLEELVFRAPLESFPKGILTLKKLRILKLLHTKLTTLPSSFKQLTTLKRLALGAPLPTFPKEILSLQNLETLELIEGTFPVVPDNINQLKQLKLLILPGPFESIPNSVFKLKNLESLKLPDAKIQAIPDNIGQLKKLRSLVLSGPFEELPPSLFQLKNLEEIRFEKANIKTIPSAIGDLRNLGIIWLGGNFQEVPKSILKLQGLKALSLNNTRNIKNIPDLSQIQGLWIFSCIVYGDPTTDETHQANIKQLKAIKTELPGCTFLLTDENADYIFLEDYDD